MDLIINNTIKAKWRLAEKIKGPLRSKYTVVDGQPAEKPNLLLRSGYQVDPLQLVLFQQI